MIWRETAGKAYAWPKRALPQAIRDTGMATLQYPKRVHRKTAARHWELGSIQLKKSTVVATVSLLLLAYVMGVATSDPQNIVHQQLKLWRNQLMSANSPLSGTFLINAMVREKPRNQLFDAFAPQVDVVMIGDSLTEGVIWSEVFPNIKIANRGIGGDRTIDILNRIDPILALHPKKVFILVGLNDLATGVSVHDALNHYQKIIARLEQHQIKVYIQSTVECSRVRCGKQVDDVRALNASLQQYAGEHDITFIDLNAQLSSKRFGLLPKYTTDGSHLTAAGYIAWSQMIQPYLAP